MRDLIEHPDPGGGAPNRNPAWADALIAVKLFAVDPAGLAGIIVRAQPGPVRDAFLALIRSAMPQGAPWRKMPAQVEASRLIGGLDLAQTLKAGRPVAERGLLAEADGGILLMAMAERVPQGVAALIARALESGEARVERDGVAHSFPSRFGIVALDEGLPEDEPLAALLRDRLAFRADLRGVATGETVSPPDWGEDWAEAVPVARLRLAGVDADDAIVQALCGAALALGIGSLRAPLLALRAARAAAALDGSPRVGEGHAALAARLVFSWRATALPPEEAPAEPESPREAPAEPQGEPGSGDDAGSGGGPIDDVVLQAARAAIPPDLLSRLQQEGIQSMPRARSGQSGVAVKSRAKGRRAGTRRGELRSGARLSLIDTLRAAAPWQPLRRRPGSDRIEVRPDDFRIIRFKQRTQSVTIFAVDASGSQAFARLAEVKGAVELLLAESYVRRDQVALIAFRGQTADLVVPPTRSLVRAKRLLAGLPGGGGTPLAAGIEASAALAEALRRKGLSPTIVLLTDGRANITRPSAGNRLNAMEDAVAAARLVKQAQLAAVFIDTSPRPRAEAQRLASEMGARYVPLPYADAAALNAVLKRRS